MKPQNLRDNLEAVQSREFVIKMSDGSALRIPHTDYIMLSEDADQAVLFVEGRRLKIIDTEHITSIEFEAGTPKRK
jgi:hypothetical protein